MKHRFLLWALTLGIILGLAHSCSRSSECKAKDKLPPNFNVPLNCKCTMEQRINNTGCCADVILVTREEWKARPTRSSEPLLLPIPYVFIHHTADTGMNLSTDAEKVRAIQDFHMDVRGWDDIGYSFLVGEDGRVYEGRGWHRVGAHTYGYNSKGIGIAIIGNFMENLPNPAQIRAVKDQINCGEINGVFQEDYYLYGHRDARDTLCPGDKLYDYIKTWPRFGPTPLHKFR